MTCARTSSRLRRSIGVIFASFAIRAASSSVITFAPPAAACTNTQGEKQSHSVSDATQPIPLLLRLRMPVRSLCCSVSPLLVVRHSCSRVPTTVEPAARENSRTPQWLECALRQREGAQDARVDQCGLFCVLAWLLRVQSGDKLLQRRLTLGRGAVFVPFTFWQVSFPPNATTLSSGRHRPLHPGVLAATARVRIASAQWDRRLQLLPHSTRTAPAASDRPL